MGLFLQAHRAFLHSSRTLLSRDSARLVIATADGLLLEEVWQRRVDGGAFELPLEKVTILVDTPLVPEPRPTSHLSRRVDPVWRRVGASLDAAAQRLLNLVQAGR